MSLIGTTKRQTSSHMAESRNLGNSKQNLLSSDMDSPTLPLAKSLRSPSPREFSRSPKRVKRREDPTTPTICAAKSSKSSNTSNEYCRSTTRIGRIPLRSTQGPWTQMNPQHRANHTSKIDEVSKVPTENDHLLPALGSDEESFGGGDIFAGTDQQQICALRSTMSSQEYDESTTDF